MKPQKLLDCKDESKVLGVRRLPLRLIQKFELGQDKSEPKARKFSFASLRL
jgi:hypothetical protein